jgi:Bacterial Ig-like domain
LKKEPDEGATEADISIPIKNIFNKAMLEETINRNTTKLLKEAENTEMGGIEVSLDLSDKDKKTILITHTPFERGKKYTIIVTAGVNDLAGNSISEEKWSFTTSSGDIA